MLCISFTKDIRWVVVKHGSICPDILMKHFDSNSFATLKLTHMYIRRQPKIQHVKLNQAQIIVCQCHGADKIFQYLKLSISTIE